MLLLFFAATVIVPGLIIGAGPKNLPKHARPQPAGALAHKGPPGKWSILVLGTFLFLHVTIVSGIAFFPGGPYWWLLILWLLVIAIAYSWSERRCLGERLHLPTGAPAALDSWSRFWVRPRTLYSGFPWARCGACLVAFFFSFYPYIWYPLSSTASAPIYQQLVWVMIPLFIATIAVLFFDSPSASPTKRWERWARLAFAGLMMVYLYAMILGSNAVLLPIRMAGIGAVTGVVLGLDETGLKSVRRFLPASEFVPDMLGEEVKADIVLRFGAEAVITRAGQFGVTKRCDTSAATEKLLEDQLNVARQQASGKKNAKSEYMACQIIPSSSIVSIRHIPTWQSTN
jgi:hypothetical protein